MDYFTAAEFLLDLKRFRSIPGKPGNETTAGLLDHLGNPHAGPSYVQITGTNGKGSTARMVESILREADLDVGLYNTPCLDYRDQITVNGTPIPRQAVTEFVERTHDYLTDRAVEGDSPTFWETFTVLALWYFGREDVDVAVLEAVSGGRNDATSVVDPVASGVTNVSLEHTGLLGDTVAEIARKKAGVAPEEGPVVTATEGDALATVREHADEVVTVGDSDAEPRPNVGVRYDGVTEDFRSRVRVRAPDWSVEAHVALPGSHQARNAGIAATLAREVADVEETAVADGLATATFPRRFEVLDREPLLIVDSAHNHHACRVVADTLESCDYDDLQLVFATDHSKDHGAMAAALPRAENVFVCEMDRKRSARRDVLERVFERRGAGKVRTADSVKAAADRAIEAAGPNDCVLVTGCSYLAGEVRRHWTRSGVPRLNRNPDRVAETLETASDDWYVLSPDETGDLPEGFVYDLADPLYFVHSSQRAPLVVHQRPSGDGTERRLQTDIESFWQVVADETEE